jgi:N-methylhydantoinase A
MAFHQKVRIGIDTGGTFTDFVVFYPQQGRVESFKLLSTPHNPESAVLQGLARIVSSLQSGSGLDIVHGSTVATNALLERKGALTALVTTRGFRDLLKIGRQNRPALYDFFADPPHPLAPDHLRLEVDERVASTGEVLIALDPQQVEGLVGELRAAGVEAVAVCLLFSFLHPQHERMIGQRLRQAGFHVSLSSEILPEYREYERTSTTVVNAYVSRVLDQYLGRLERAVEQGSFRETSEPAKLAEVSLRIMQSNGGQISLVEARQAAVRCILSGPAGGITGAHYVARQAANQVSLLRENCPAFDPSRLITFDMGGTSTDAALIAGSPLLTTESMIGGMPIRVPVLDIHTIGAGGGSIGMVDLGGALRVGPESAGADPGPACYGRGQLPTVTDANLVLGRLASEHFLGGQMPLQPERAKAALSRLGAGLGLSAEEAALGMIEVVNAHMERALRLISVERGHDPGRAGGAPFTLLSFGGAGGLHAVDLARRMNIPAVLVPPLASTLSAFGMLAAEVVKDYTQTVMLPGSTTPERVVAAFQPLVERGRADLAAEGLPEKDIRIERLLDLRYKGQSYELTIPFEEQTADTFPGTFHNAHHRAYGYEHLEAPLEIVNLRVLAAGRVEPPPLQPLPLVGEDALPALLELRQVIIGSGITRQVPFYQYEALQPGNRLKGPAVVVRGDTTIWLGPTDHSFVDSYLNLWILIGDTT